MKYTTLISLVLIATVTFAQTDEKKADAVTTTADSTVVQDPDSGKLIRYWIYDTTGFVKIELNEEDTIFVYEFEEFLIKDFTTAEQRAEFERLKYNVRKVLPYAKLAAFRLQMMEDNLNMLTSKREKEKYIKETEKAIKDEFMATLKKMTRSQGILLIKLIHRETGKTTYDILKGYRGNAETFYWSVFAKMYDADLKSEYDPILDYQIELIIDQFNLE